MTHPAIVRLSIGQQRSLRKSFELHFEHVGPGALSRQVVRERIVAERPGVPFAPESIHERIDIFDDRIAIEFRRQLSNQFLKCLLKKRMVIAGLITRMWILQKSLSFSRALLTAN